MRAAETLARRRLRLYRGQRGRSERNRDAAPRVYRPARAPAFDRVTRHICRDRDEVHESLEAHYVCAADEKRGADCTRTSHEQVSGRQRPTLQAQLRTIALHGGCAQHAFCDRVGRAETSLMQG